MAKLGKTIKDVIRGDTRREDCTWLESDGVTPINLSNGTAYFTVSTLDNPTTDTNAIIQKVATVFTDAVNGHHIFTLSHADTNITPGDYWYDASFIDQVGNYLSSYKGKFIVVSDITRT